MCNLCHTLPIYQKGSITYDKEKQKLYGFSSFNQHAENSSYHYSLSLCTPDGGARVKGHAVATFVWRILRLVGGIYLRCGSEQFSSPRKSFVSSYICIWLIVAQNNSNSVFA